MYILNLNKRKKIFYNFLLKKKLKNAILFSYLFLILSLCHLFFNDSTFIIFCFKIKL